MDKSRKVRNELVAFTNKCHLVLLFRPARREETFQKFLNDLSSAKICGFRAKAISVPG